MLQTCRICLRSSNDITIDISVYSDIVQKIAQIELIVSDEYPSKVCKDCSNDLLNADLLRDMLLECNQKPIATEVAEEDVVLEFGIDEATIEIESYVENTNEILESQESNENSHVQKKRVKIRDRAVQRLNPITNKNRRHTGLIKLICHHCSTDEPNLEAHMRRVHSELPIEFQCPYCSKTFDTIKSLKSHYKYHVSASYVCDECGQKFMFQGSMSEHKRIKHLKLKRFFCEICPTGFMTKHGLNVHMRGHSGEKPHKCHYCPKAYIHYSDWKAHESGHTGEWKRNCPVCNKGFYKPSVLRNHMKLH